MQFKKRSGIKLVSITAKMKSYQTKETSLIPTSLLGDFEVSNIQNALTEYAHAHKLNRVNCQN